MIRRPALDRTRSMAVTTRSSRAARGPGLLHPLDTVYERAGFRAVRTYMHTTNGGDWEFLEMRRPA